MHCTGRIRRLYAKSKLTSNWDFTVCLVGLTCGHGLSGCYGFILVGRCGLDMETFSSSGQIFSRTVVVVEKFRNRY